MTQTTWKVGDYAKVIEQDIEGYVVAVYHDTLVLRDESLEIEMYEGDNCLEFRFRDVRKLDRAQPN